MIDVIDRLNLHCIVYIKMFQNTNSVGGNTRESIVIDALSEVGCNYWN